MTISATQNNVSHVTKQIADLNKSDAELTKKEADLLAKINRASDAASRTRSASTAGMKLKEIERATKDMAGVRSKRADISKKIADATKNLQGYQQQLAREEERSRKKVTAEEKRRMRDREAHERRITSELRSRRQIVEQSMPTSGTAAGEMHDFFISHASEDKDSFVRSLAEALRERGANVWYDEFTLKIGDSLRREIDRGLGNSRFGIVVLSENFFNKEWPSRELDGLVTMETRGSAQILPIWHKVSKDEVAAYSPTLADKVALNTSMMSVGQIAAELMELIE